MMWCNVCIVLLGALMDNGIVVRCVLWDATGISETKSSNVFGTRDWKAGRLTIRLLITY